MYIADLHIHSKYSRATSKELEPEPLDAWARRKGIGLVAPATSPTPPGGPSCGTSWPKRRRDSILKGPGRTRPGS